MSSIASCVALLDLPRGVACRSRRRPRRLRAAPRRRRARGRRRARAPQRDGAAPTVAPTPPRRRDGGGPVRAEPGRRRGGAGAPRGAPRPPPPAPFTLNGYVRGDMFVGKVPGRARGRDEGGLRRAGAAAAHREDDLTATASPRRASATGCRAARRGRSSTCARPTSTRTSARSTCASASRSSSGGAPTRSTRPTT